MGNIPNHRVVYSRGDIWRVLPASLLEFFHIWGHLYIEKSRPKFTWVGQGIWIGATRHYTAYELEFFSRWFWGVGYTANPDIDEETYLAAFLASWVRGGFSPTLTLLFGSRLFSWLWRWPEAHDIARLPHIWCGAIDLWGNSKVLGRFWGLMDHGL